MTVAGSAPQLRPFVAGDLDGTIDALVRAFDDDPAFLYLFPNRSQRCRALAWLQSVAITTALRNGGEVTLSGDGAGTCISYPEGAFPPRRRAYMSLIGALTNLPLASIPRALRTLRLMHVKHPKEIPHIYVEVLGVDPEGQRGGHGTALLSQVCEKADAEAIAVYLETTKPENVTYYNRFGFSVMETGRFRNGPQYWLMLRDAREG